MFANELSFTHRISLVFFACIAAWLTVGVTYGFQALKWVLEKEGVYESLCKDGEAKPCPAQIVRLSLMFSAAALSTAMSQLPAGTILDYIGPKYTFGLGSFVFGIGNLLLAISTPAFDGYIAGFVLMSFGGLLMYMAIIHISLTFPNRSGTIMALLSGGFDTSAVVFPIYQLVYRLSDGYVTPRVWFLGYLVVPVALLFANFALQPNESLEWFDDSPSSKANREKAKQRENLDAAGMGVDVVHVDSDDTVGPPPKEAESKVVKVARSGEDENTPLLGEVTPEAVESAAAHVDPPSKLSQRQQFIQTLSAWSQLATPEWFLNTLWMFFFMMRINFYITSVAEQLSEKHIPGGSATPEEEQAMRDTILNVFNYTLSLGATATIPVVGWLLDNFPIHVNLVGQFFVFAAPFALFGLSSNLSSQYIVALCGGFLRPFMYSATITYASQTFGFKSFGRVYGLQMFLCGFSNIIQYQINSFVLNGQHGHYFLANLFSIAVSASPFLQLLTFIQPIVLIFPLYLIRMHRREMHAKAVAMSSS
ncbi:MFS general substrate transporter [Gonapodya prolifera JEL478]|uniref:MFS general substrate transporter n=1 Tax=Gonapodya prolifera (strain JEL478) TaxID=1344416 RepID=A0A139APA8_GONPJ|nr:MFS general substrate transporter [Gonapodya prolifera JEL478]|eukprot:KXS18325.1 MFS general substrate transporter [Gonapodya prolifera JEL478]